jgi:hypothetical protein
VNHQPNSNRSTTMTTITDLHFGVCPKCHSHDGYINIGQGHWFYCREHRVRWFGGANLFDSWKLETDDEQRETYAALQFDQYRSDERVLHRPDVPRPLTPRCAGHPASLVVAGHPAINPETTLPDDHHRPPRRPVRLSVVRRTSSMLMPVRADPPAHRGHLPLQPRRRPGRRVSRRDPQRYGPAHRRHRRRLVARYEWDGRGWPCAICHQPMNDHPRQLHLAHDDHGGWLGLAHADCNTGDAGRLALTRLRGTNDPPPTPRTRW